MKIRRPTLKIFISNVEKLEADIIPKLKDNARDWIRLQEEREQYGSADPYWLSLARDSLERSLDDFREAISELYDFQNEKGLVDVHEENAKTA
jgi:hypothetical protein